MNRRRTDLIGVSWDWLEGFYNKKILKVEELEGGIILKEGNRYTCMGMLNVCSLPRELGRSPKSAPGPGMGGSRNTRGIAWFREAASSLQTYIKRVYALRIMVLRA